MSWRVVLRQEVQEDITEASAWYNDRKEGLGGEFCEAVLRVLDSLADNPFLNCRRHNRRNIRWQYVKIFPYRVVYEIFEADNTVVVAAVLHAARDARHWRKRL